MTVSTEIDSEKYIGNGVTSTFPYRFRIFQPSDMVVTRIDLGGVETILVLGTDYTITGSGGYSGGNVILISALADGFGLTLARDLPITQETDLRNQGTFFAEVHEDAFDKLTMIIQQVWSGFGLALRRNTVLSKFYDAKDYRISNLSDPVNDQDAVNVRSMGSYVEKMVAGVVGGFGWFIQSGAGAKQRTFQDKMRDTVSLKDYEDGSGDWRSALQNAVNALSPRGGTIIVPRGSYNVYGTINCLNMPLSIQGEGMMSTELIQMSPESDLLNYVSNTPGNYPSHNSLLINTLKISDISFNKGAGIGGKAVNAKWVLMTSNSPQCILNNFRAYSVNDGGKGWSKGVSLTHCNGLRIDNVQLLGVVLFTDPTGILPYKSETGLELINEDNTLGLISFFIKSLTIMRFNVSNDIQGWHEGVAIINSELVQNSYGIRVTGHPVRQNPVLFIANTHIDARFRGIDATNVFKLKLSNCDVFKNGGAIPVNGDNIKLTGCVFPSFVGVSFSSNDIGVNNNGIAPDENSYYGIVSGCHFTGHTGTSLDLRSENWNVQPNVFYTNNIAIYQNASRNIIGLQSMRGNTNNTLVVSGVSNQVTPRKYRVRHTHNQPTQTFELSVQVPIPANMFISSPEGGTLVSTGSLFISYAYDAGSSNQNLAIFKVRDFENAQLSPGNYVFECSLESYAI